MQAVNQTTQSEDIKKIKKLTQEEKIILLVQLKALGYKRQHEHDPQA